MLTRPVKFITPFFRDNRPLSLAVKFIRTHPLTAMSVKFIRAHRLLSTAFFLIALGLFACGSLIVVVTMWPSLAAMNIDKLRDVIGDERVAQLETLYLNTQDTVKQWGVQLGVLQPTIPWTEAAVSADEQSLSRGKPAAQVAPSPKQNTAVSAGGPPARVPSLEWAWEPTPLEPLGTLADEGQWSAYLQNPAGQTIAYRTFLQPDPKRPYAVAAVVAFNLDVIRLHLVLGSDEPKSEVKVPRPGKIPEADLQSGLLLAAFNGGFKSRHGHYGLMVDEVTVLPPKAGIGTVAMYADGRVRIGAWGTEINPTADLVAWRQNGPLIVSQGQINPHTSDDTSNVWGGYVLSNLAPSWRSALGISPDGRTLYYLAGPSLSLPALAQAVVATGATEAIQLDVGNFWVHFAAVQTVGTTLKSVPLLETMTESPDRYLKQYPRDFFYVTANPEPAPH